MIEYCKFSFCSSTDEVQSCGLSTNNKFLRGTPGPSMVVIYWVPVFIYLYIFDNKTLLHSKPVKAVPVRISLLGIRTNSCDLIKYLSALQLFLHNSICLHKRPLVHWIKVRSDTKMEVIPILVKAVSICLLLFTESLKQSLFIYSSLLRVFWDKGASWEQPGWGALKDGPSRSLLHQVERPGFLKCLNPISAPD